MIYTISSWSADLSQFGEVFEAVDFHTDIALRYVILTPAQFCYLMLKYTPRKEKFADNSTNLFLWPDGVCTLGSNYLIKKDLEKKGVLCTTYKHVDEKTSL